MRKRDLQAVLITGGAVGAMGVFLLAVLMVVGMASVVQDSQYRREIPSLIRQRWHYSEIRVNSISAPASHPRGEIVEVEYERFIQFRWFHFREHFIIRDGHVVECIVGGESETPQKYISAVL